MTWMVSYALRALLTGIVTGVALLLATPLAAQCPNPFTSANFPSTLGRPLTTAEAENYILENLVGICSGDLRVEDLSTACADDKMLAASAGGLVCVDAPSGGGGTFTSLDVDYGAETVTSAWDLSGAKTRLPSGTAPTSGDCDAAGEAGRIFVDTDAASGRQVYVCEGLAGWKLQGDGGGLTLRGVATETGPVNTTTAVATLDVQELNGLSLADSLLGADKILKLDIVPATGSSYGAIFLAGDLSGLASSPQVANDSHTHGTSTIGGLDANLDISTGQLAPARGGTGISTSASTGVPRVSSGTWTVNAGLAHLASSTSADLAALLSNETGSGAVVFGTSPSIASPTIFGFTASKCARFDGSGNLVAASGDCSAGDTSGAGTVTAVSGPPEFSWATPTSTPTATWASQAQNLLLASPNGSSGTPSFRALVAADIPTLNQNTTGNADTATTAANGDSAAGFFPSGTVDTARLGSGTADSTKFLRGDQTWATVTAGIGGSTGATDNAVLRADGTGGSTAQGSSVTMDDAGSMTLPDAASIKWNDLYLTHQAGPFLQVADAAGTSYRTVRARAHEAFNGSTLKVAVDPAGRIGLAITQEGGITWDSSSTLYTGSADLGIARAAAGVGKVTNGGSGDGSLTAKTWRDVPQASPPVACGDANTLGYRYTDTSIADCWCNGTIWIVVAGAGSCA